MKNCIWQYDREANAWDTECGNAHYFTDGGPEFNEYKFCPYCGKPLQEI